MTVEGPGLDGDRRWVLPTDRRASLRASLRVERSGPRVVDVDVGAVLGAEAVRRHRRRD